MHWRANASVQQCTALGASAETGGWPACPARLVTIVALHPSAWPSNSGPARRVLVRREINVGHQLKEIPVCDGLRLTLRSAYGYGRCREGRSIRGGPNLRFSTRTPGQGLGATVRPRQKAAIRSAPSIRIWSRWRCACLIERRPPARHGWTIPARETGRRSSSRRRS